MRLCLNKNANYEMIKALLNDPKIDVNVKSRNNYTALHEILDHLKPELDNKDQSADDPTSPFYSTRVAELLL